MCELPQMKKIEIQVTGTAGGTTITMDEQGGISIEAKGPTGKIDLKAPTGAVSIDALDVTVEAKKQLTLKGSLVNIESTGPAAIKGKPIQLN
jgi:DUF4097 and DUF4098 domain-containing protein YvlB